MSITVLKQPSGLFNVRNSKLGAIFFNLPQDATTSELADTAGHLYLSPGELGKLTLILGAANPQAQAAALGVDYVNAA